MTQQNFIQLPHSNMLPLDHNRLSSLAFACIMFVMLNPCGVKLGDKDNKMCMIYCLTQIELLNLRAVTKLLLFSLFVSRMCM